MRSAFPGYPGAYGGMQQPQSAYRPMGPTGYPMPMLPQQAQVSAASPKGAVSHGYQPQFFQNAVQQPAYQAAVHRAASPPRMGNTSPVRRELSQPGQQARTSQPMQGQQMPMQYSGGQQMPMQYGAGQRVSVIAGMAAVPHGVYSGQTSHRGSAPIYAQSAAVPAPMMQAQVATPTMPQRRTLIASAPSPAAVNRGPTAGRVSIVQPMINIQQAPAINIQQAPGAPMVRFQQAPDGDDGESDDDAPAPVAGGLARPGMMGAQPSMFGPVKSEFYTDSTISEEQAKAAAKLAAKIATKQQRGGRR